MNKKVNFVFTSNELNKEEEEAEITNSSSNNCHTFIKPEENPGDFECVPIYAASLLDPSFIENKGTLNEVKVEEGSSSLPQNLLMGKDSVLMRLWKLLGLLV